MSISTMLPILMMTRGRSFLFVVLLTICGFAQAETWNYPKPAVLEFLSSWKTQVLQDPYLDDRERDLREDLIDRLIFQIDRKYNEGSLREFMIACTQDMALTDEMTQNQVFQSSTEFLRNLNTGFKEILEPSENILAFLRSFVEFSSLKAPLALDAFAESRSYTNGFETESARPSSLEEAGQFAENLPVSPSDKYYHEGLILKVDLSPETESLEIPPQATPLQNPNSLLPQTEELPQNEENHSQI